MGWALVSPSPWPGHPPAAAREGGSERDMLRLAKAVGGAKASQCPPPWPSGFAALRPDKPHAREGRVRKHSAVEPGRRCGRGPSAPLPGLRPSLPRGSRTRGRD